MFYNFFEKIYRRQQLSILRKNPNVFFDNIRLGVGGRFVLDNHIKKVSIGKSVEFRNYTCILVMKDASLEIGDHFFMNNFCSINCLEHISIGENTLFGENVKLYDHNHTYETSPTFKLHPSKFT